MTSTEASSSEEKVATLRALHAPGDPLLDHSEGTSCPIDPAEPRGHRPCNDDACHLHVAVDHDLLDVVPQIWHRSKSVFPDRLLVFNIRRGESERRVDDHVRMKQLAESPKVARVSGCKRSKHDCLVSVRHSATPPPVAQRRSGRLKPSVARPIAHPASGR